MTLAARVDELLGELRGLGSPEGRAGMARFALPSENAFGISMGVLQRIARRIGRDQPLSLALWETGWYEARTLAALIGEPAQVTPEQMDDWAHAFDNWGICDTVCFTLFDRTPHAWDRVDAWSREEGEFTKRGAFALLASLALHDKAAPDDPFLASLSLIAGAAGDGRNFVKKGVSWALVGVGSRNPTLHSAALGQADALAQGTGSTRWIGRDAGKKLRSAATLRRVGRSTA
jgi:3-methyladenine DNA glycosylase AlkD